MLHALRRSYANPFWMFNQRERNNPQLFVVVNLGFETCFAPLWGVPTVRLRGASAKCISTHNVRDLGETSKRCTCVTAQQSMIYVYIIAMFRCRSRPLERCVSGLDTTQSEIDDKLGDMEACATGSTVGPQTSLDITFSTLQCNSMDEVVVVKSLVEHLRKMGINGVKEGDVRLGCGSIVAHISNLSEEDAATIRNAEPTVVNAVLVDVRADYSRRLEYFKRALARAKGAHKTLACVDRDNLYNYASDGLNSTGTTNTATTKLTTSRGGDRRRRRSTDTFQTCVYTDANCLIEDSAKCTRTAALKPRWKCVGGCIDNGGEFDEPGFSCASTNFKAGPNGLTGPCVGQQGLIGGTSMQMKCIVRGDRGTQTERNLQAEDTPIHAAKAAKTTSAAAEDKVAETKTAAANAASTSASDRASPSTDDAATATAASRVCEASRELVEAAQARLADLREKKKPAPVLLEDAQQAVKDAATAAEKCSNSNLDKECSEQEKDLLFAKQMTVGAFTATASAGVKNVPVTTPHGSFDDNDSSTDVGLIVGVVAAAAFVAGIVACVVYMIIVMQRGRSAHTDVINGDVQSVPPAFANPAYQAPPRTNQAHNKVQDAPAADTRHSAQDTEQFDGFGVPDDEPGSSTF